MTVFDPVPAGDVADRLIARRLDDDRIVVEAVRPAAPHWHVRVDRDLAMTSAGRVARAVFDESGAHDGDDWLVSHKYVRDLTEALAHGDDGALLRVIADHHRNRTKES